MAPQAELVKVICRDCRRSIHKCVCRGPMKERAMQVRVFEERDVRRAFERLDAGEPLAALDVLRELLRKPSTDDRTEVTRRL